MIRKINKIEKFGIFQKLKPDSLTPFDKFNLIYGWNGSGKTTLARLLRCIEKTKLNEDYPEAEFEIELDNNSKLDRTFNRTLNIRVFNSDFVNQNLQLADGTADPIIYISEESGKQKAELEALKKSLAEKINEKEKKEGEIKTNQNSIEAFHKDAGKAIKDFFLTTIHANVTYNKTTSEKIWNDVVANSTTLADCVMNDDQLSGLKEFILPNSFKDKINYYYPKLDQALYQSLEGRVKSAIEKKITSKVIQRLKGNPEINNWVLAGYKLHKEKSNVKCEFCGQPLPENRLDELEAHFNEEYQTLMNELIDLKAELNKAIIPDIPDHTGNFFEQLRIEYNQLFFSHLKGYVDDINKMVRSWIGNIEQKMNNPFTSNMSFYSVVGEINTYNTFAVDTNRYVIDKHNKLSEDYEIKAREIKEIIEKHFVAQKAISDELRSKEGKLKTLSEAVNSITNNDIKTLNKQISELENSLKNDSLAINEINDNLKQFLGDNNVILKRRDEGGYQLLRNDIKAKNLSEGEKTAIALVYFISKIKENDNKIEDTIVVVDDPVSSFDSNHLFNAVSFITNNCGAAKQLFILTHNFWFFKLAKDWMKDQKVDGSKKGQCFRAYELKEGLKDAHSALLDYNSEYHFVFKTIFDYSINESSTMEENWSIANIGRRVFESFLSFKFPGISGQGKLYQLARKAKELLPDEMKGNVDVLYRFFNKYSHLDRIEYHENIPENIGGEGRKMAIDLLKMIDKLDCEHYKSMMSICKTDTYKVKQED